MKEKEKQADPWFDPEELRRNLARTPEERLRCLEELNRFFHAFMPEKSKRIWEELKAKGW